MKWEKRAEAKSQTDWDVLLGTLGFIQLLENRLIIIRAVTTSGVESSLWKTLLPSPMSSVPPDPLPRYAPSPRHTNLFEVPPRQGPPRLYFFIGKADATSFLRLCPAWATLFSHSLSFSTSSLLPAFTLDDISFKMLSLISPNWICSLPFHSHNILFLPPLEK